MTVNQASSPLIGTQPPVGTAIVSTADHTPQQDRKLFTPLTLRGLTLKNRTVVSPMCMYTAEEGLPNDWHLVHLGGFATRGVGLIIAEATAVLPNGRITPYCTGIWGDQHIAPWKRVVDFAHSTGTPIALQLAHAGRKASTYTMFDKENQGYAPPESGGWTDVWGPSAIAHNDTLAVPHAVTLEEIAQIIQAYQDAAVRADKAGFDAVEIHSAHGYLLHSFLSPLSNKRTDQYGGSFENRIRLLLEVVQAVREVWPQEKPLFVRVSATDWVEDEPSWDTNQTVELAKRLELLEVDLLDISSGGSSPRQKIQGGPLYQVPFASQVKAAVTKLHVGAVGVITRGQEAEDILRQNQADVIIVGRAFLRNPAWTLEAALELDVPVVWSKQYERGRPKKHFTPV
ncbi:hypothetical protein IWQ62_001044 [Dispira parvispora]|uniref:NADH:flavin oxidoreductase/NADH oxidase N-terminal domain-containing protein n=1 Tax=Dispira parvispora TaxID=1520584 RepID=A0A9W8ATC3_9FUNG|nr:hypothetical protein IWQ62_001044 [Dispira parvispora]